MTTPRILIVEDTPETLEWLRQIVARAFPAAGIESAETLALARQTTERLGSQLDLIIVDLGLPDGSGVDLITDLRGHGYQVQIVVATIYDDDHSLASALKAGANGYILKDEDRESVAALLRGMLEGEQKKS